jgi:hypothetical protein
MTSALAIGVLLALAASPAPAAPAAPGFSGELVFSATGGDARSASFDDARLLGPTVSVARRQDGTWAGDVSGHGLAVAVSEQRLTAAGLDLHVRHRGQSLAIEGLFHGTRVAFDYGPKALKGRIGRCSFDLRRQSPGLLRGEAGCLRRRGLAATTAVATLSLKGEAAAPSPPLPQFALGLLAVLPQ